MIGSVRTPRLAGKCRSGMVHVSAPKPPGGATRRHGNADLRPVLPVGAGTARRRRANGAVLLSPTVQTRPMITAQIRKVQGRVRRKKAPFAALRAAVPTRGRRSLAGAPLCSISIAPLAPLRGAVPTGGRRSKRSPRFIAVGSTRFRGPGGPRCRSETGAPSGPRGSSRFAFSRPWRAAMPVGDRRSKRSPRFFAIGSTRFRGPFRPRCRSETGVPSGPRDSSRSAVFPVR